MPTNARLLSSMTSVAAVAAAVLLACCVALRPVASFAVPIHRAQPTLPRVVGGSTAPAPSRAIPTTKTTSRNMFGNALKDAFGNDDSLGKRENAGIKGGPKVNEVTINGKPVRAVANQRVSQVAAAARVKITYSCKKGDCGTCEVFMNERIVRACQAKIPAGRCAIETFS